MKRFHASREIIESVLVQMKRGGYIHPQAEFNLDAEHDLRKEVTYRDEDFLSFLSRTPYEEHFIDSAMNYLIQLGHVSPSSNYSKTAFPRFRKKIKETFQGTWTSITPVMERFLYMLTSVKRPSRLVELGSFWGNTLVWFAGPCLSEYRQFEVQEIIGIDIDEKMCDLAASNFSKLPHSESVRIVAGDAKGLCDSIEGPIDFLYLEAKSDKEPDLYLTLLQQLYDKLPKGAWVIAHDIYDKDDMHHLVDYLSWVRDKRYFADSMAFDLDNYGMELSIR